MPRPTLPVIALAAGALLLGSAGGATAGALVTGAQIKDGSITGIDVKDRSLATRDLTRPTVRQLRGARGPAGKPGVVRAWAKVSGNGTVLLSSPGLRVTHEGTGFYCITAPGIPAPATTVVTPDLELDDTITGAGAPQTFTEVASTLSCPTGTTTSVATLTRSYSGGNATLAFDDAGFHVLIP
jgi:hypothetical protein